MPCTLDPADDLSTMSMDPEAPPEVDYMAVVLLIFGLLDSDMTARQLSEALDLAATQNSQQDHAIRCNSNGRARLACSLVDTFLLKDSYERATQGNDR